MTEQEVLELLRNFAGGNTLVALYFVFALVRYILLPVYRNGKLVKGLCESLQNALNEGVFGHKEIVAELQALRKVLERV